MCWIHQSILIGPISILPTALDNSPGVRPVGIGDTAQRIISKAFLLQPGKTCKKDVHQATGCSQLCYLCTGQTAGVGAAVHAGCAIFSDEANEAILLVDASNHFQLFKPLHCSPQYKSVTSLMSSFITCPHKYLTESLWLGPQWSILKRVTLSLWSCMHLLPFHLSSICKTLLMDLYL